MRAVLALVFALVGCAAQPGTDWYGDRDFTDEERAGIEAGFRFDAENSGKPVPSISWTLERDAQAMPRTIRRELAPIGPDGATGGCKGETIYLWPVDRLEINAPWRAEYMPGLAAHELAHCWLHFGDDYADDHIGEGIMGTIYPMRWTDSERAQCREQGC